MGATEVPFQLIDQSIVFPVTVNGQGISCVLDTGDAIGPTFTSADAMTCRLVHGPSEGIEGAGGASAVYETTATINVGGIVFAGEQGAIDGELEGWSLLGLPFFAAKCARFEIDITRSQLVLIGV
jgi:hypothetical protein